MAISSLGIQKKKTHEMEVNLVPILDMLIVLIFFLILTSVFTVYSRVETPAPVINLQDDVPENKDLKLNLTAILFNDSVELQGGFGKLYEAKIPNKEDGTLDQEAVHQKIIEIKRQFPNEDVIIVKPMPNVSYNTIIDFLDQARELEKTDEPIFKPDDKGTPTEIRELFPNVVFGNVRSTDEEELEQAAQMKGNR